MTRYALIIFVLGSLFAGCGSDRRRSLPASTTSGATTATTAGATSASTSASSSSSASSSTTSSGTATLPPPGGTAITSAPVNPATTITVIAGGFGLGGATSTGVYGTDEPDRIATDIAAKLGRPLGVNSPTAPNQVTLTRYYGGQPPAYYSAQDLQDVNAAGPGAPRYAAIVAKHVREVLRRSGATHVNLAGGSFGGLITRYLIEHDLEGHASNGRIVRWLTLEGAHGGSYLASRLTSRPVMLQILASLTGSNANPADIDDLRTGTYDFLRRVFNTPDPSRSTSPYFRNIMVGNHVATDDDLSNHTLTILSRKPNDGVLLATDQYLTQIDARPVGPAVVFTDTTHYTTARDPGAIALAANFLRSRKRVRIRLLDALVRDFSESFLFGRGEIAFDAAVSSPEALREWGVNQPLTQITERHGTAPMERCDRGDTAQLDATVFDWFVAPGEQALELEIEANELDQNLWYRVVEHTSRRREHMDTATISLPVTATGTFTHVMDTPSFRLNIEVRVTTE